MELFMNIYSLFIDISAVWILHSFTQLLNNKIYTLQSSFVKICLKSDEIIPFNQGNPHFWALSSPCTQLSFFFSIHIVVFPGSLLEALIRWGIEDADLETE